MNRLTDSITHILRECNPPRLRKRPPVTECWIALRSHMRLEDLQGIQDPVTAPITRLGNICDIFWNTLDSACKQSNNNTNKGSVDANTLHILQHCQGFGQQT